MKLVMKFGGSSVASAERIKNVADRVKGNGKGHQVVVVCSAMGDVTDSLLALCSDASKGLEMPVEERLASIRKMHLAALDSAVSDKAVRRQVLGMLNVTLSQLEKLARGSTVLGEADAEVEGRHPGVRGEALQPHRDGGAPRERDEGRLHDRRGGRDNDRRPVRRRHPADGGDEVPGEGEAVAAARRGEDPGRDRVHRGHPERRHDHPWEGRL